MPGSWPPNWLHGTPSTREARARQLLVQLLEPLVLRRQPALRRHVDDEHRLVLGEPGEVERLALQGVDGDVVDRHGAGNLPSGPMETSCRGRRRRRQRRRRRDPGRDAGRQPAAPRRRRRRAPARRRRRARAPPRRLEGRVAVVLGHRLRRRLRRRRVVARRRRPRAGRGGRRRRRARDLRPLGQRLATPTTTSTLVAEAFEVAPRRAVRVRRRRGRRGGVGAVRRARGVGGAAGRLPRLAGTRTRTWLLRSSTVRCSRIDRRGGATA